MWGAHGYRFHTASSDFDAHDDLMVTMTLLTLVTRLQKVASSTSPLLCWAARPPLALLGGREERVKVDWLHVEDTTIYLYLQSQLGEYVADFGCICCLVQQANDSLCGLQGVTGGGLGVNRALQIIRGRTRVSRNDNPGWLNTAGLAYVHFVVGFILRETQKNHRVKPNLMQESGSVKPILCT